jgi:uncharacterized protein with HEPN domain
MPQRDLRAYLADVALAIQQIETSVAGLSLDAYRSTRQVRSAVEREFMIIGEAIRQLLIAEPALESRLSAAAQIVAFRNHLVHGYFLIADQTVWDIIHGHLPKPKAEILSLAAERDL